MGKYSKGYEDVTGRFGNIVLYKLEGEIIGRTIGKRTQEPTPAEQAQRAKFSLIAKFLSPLRRIITKSYANGGSGKSALGAASSYHMRETIIGEYPNYVVDFNKVVITKAYLLEMSSTEVTPQPNAQLNISWHDNSNQALANATDTLLVMIYNETSAEWRTVLDVRRDAQHYVVNLPLSWIGSTVHCWLAFYDETTNSYSTNIYKGPLLLQ